MKIITITKNPMTNGRWVSADEAQAEIDKRDVLIKRMAKMLKDEYESECPVCAGWDGAHEDDCSFRLMLTEAEAMTGREG